MTHKTTDGQLVEPLAAAITRVLPNLNPALTSRLLLDDPGRVRITTAATAEMIALCLVYSRERFKQWEEEAGL